MIRKQFRIPWRRALIVFLCFGYLMPVSNNTTARAKKISFDVKGKSATTQRGPREENQFLTIAPALPILPGAPVPAKLSKRSHNLLNSTGSPFDGQHAELTGCEVVNLQWTGEGRTIMATRAQAERDKNPDRICLDRRGLTTFPAIIGEPKLRLLSLQHNLLTTIEGHNFTQLTKLVFLDLYDNQIEKICNLYPLENIRVLLIGKNRIKKIDGLKQLSKLEVLDLHGNQILQVSGLEDLASLKVLNLAGNNIKNIGYNDFQGLTSLKELNLKRNKIKKLLGFGETPQLQKLYLSNNDIYKIEDMGSVAKALQIREITIDGNPVTLNSDYVSFLVSYLPNLQFLSTMQINEHIRRTAMAWRTNKEQSNSAFLDLSAQVCMNARREEIISNAKVNWELLRSRTKSFVGNSNKIPNSKTLDMSGIHIQNANSFNAPKPKGLDKSKSNAFGSLTSVNENVEATKINIKKRSNSSDNLYKLEDAARTYPLEFKLPPILGSIVDNLTNTKYNDKLYKDTKACLKKSNRLVGLESESGSESDSSESHESLKSGLRSHLLSTTGRTSSIESDKQFTCKNLSVTKSTSMSALRTRKDNKNIFNKLSSTENKNILHYNTPEIGREDVKSKLSHRASKSSSDINGLCEYELKSNTSSSGYCSSNSKASSVDSCKSLLSDSSGSVGNKTAPHKNQDWNKDKYRIKSAQPKKVVHYKSNRAATARAKYRALTPPNLPVEQAPPKEREQGGDYLIEIVGRCLNVYGQGALRFIDRPWDLSKAEDVNVVKFNYVQFNSVATVLNKVKNRFANAEHFVFKETNISHLGQINAIAEIQGLTSIQIEIEGNPIVSKDWRTYAVFRLAHWGLKIINGKEVTEEEIEFANREYAGLIDIVMSSLPEALLQPLLQRMHLEKMQRQNGEQITAKQFLFSSDPALRSVVAKEALQWRKGNVTQEDLIWRHKGKIHLLRLINHTVNAIQKLQILDREWPSILNDIVHNILSDFSEMDVYMKHHSKMLEHDK